MVGSKHAKNHKSMCRNLHMIMTHLLEWSLPEKLWICNIKKTIHISWNVPLLWDLAAHWWISQPHVYDRWIFKLCLYQKLQFIKHDGKKFFCLFFLLCFDYISLIFYNFSLLTFCLSNNSLCAAAYLISWNTNSRLSINRLCWTRETPNNTHNMSFLTDIFNGWY